MKSTYRVFARGQVPADLAEKLAELQAKAIRSAAKDGAAQVATPTPATV